jgi:hypothetical protein
MEEMRNYAEIISLRGRENLEEVGVVGGKCSIFYLYT